MPDDSVDEFRYSVVIPTHGRRDLVQQALESVWSQSHAPTEVIVVIDGDTDDTAGAIRAAYPSTQVITLEGNRGPAAARNVGVAAATATWVAFLDDDDLWHHDKQTRIREHILARPDCLAVRCEFWLFHSPDEQPGAAYGLQPELVGRSRPELEQAALTAAPINDLSYLDIEGYSLPLMLERNRGVVSGTVVRRDLLETLPPVPDDLRHGQDWLLFIHVAAQTEWHLVPERLVFTRLHAAQITRGGRGAEYVVAVLHDAWNRYGSRDGIHLRTYGRAYSGMVQGWVWARLRARDVPGAVAGYRRARPFLPRALDRVRVWCPPQVTWRWDRLRGRFRD